MASNLRVRFHEKQRKRLSQSIVFNPTSSKKACPEPTLAPTPMSVPSTTAAVVAPKSDEKLLSIDEHVYHETRRPFVVPENISEKSFDS